MKDAKETVFLSPTRDTLKVSGDLFYSEGSQSWNIIRLKKEILHEFPQLKEKRGGNFGYNITIFRTFDDLDKAVKGFEKREEVVPMLLVFCKKIS